MTFIVLDTETTGLFDFKKPADDPSQPRLAHLHMIRADKAGEAQESHDFLIQPDETWTEKNFADLEAPSNPNPLTREILERDGVPLSDALDVYVAAIEDGEILTAFNAQFDMKVMRSELRRAGRDDMFDQTRNICVMRPMVDFCKLPKARGGGFKFPKLTEAMAFLGEELDDAHSADADTEGARKCLQFLIAKDALPAAAVHRAKAGTDSHKALEARGKTA